MPISGFTVSYSFNTGAQQTDIINTTINPGDTLIHIFSSTANLFAYGFYKFKAYVDVSGDINKDKIRVLLAFVLLLYGASLFIGLLSGSQSMLHPFEKFTAKSSLVLSSNSFNNSRLLNSQERKESIKPAKGYSIERLLKEVKASKKPVIVDFWALWCVPCIKLLPHLSSLADEHENLRILAISEDSKRQSEKAGEFANEKGWNVTTLYDPTGEIKKLLGVNVIPETFYIKPNREIYFHHYGFEEGEEIEMKEIFNKMIETLNK